MVYMMKYVVVIVIVVIVVVIVIVIVIAVIVIIISQSQNHLIQITLQFLLSAVDGVYDCCFVD